VLTTFFDGACHSRVINGAPGLTLRAPDGAKQTVAFDIEDGRIAAIYIVLNPEKLRHIAV
jgi:RNA polymerase sigma-70 factor, ECF subfamily